MSLDAKQIYQLRSAARRGLLENDLILERFFHRFAHELNEEQGKALSTLLQLDDNDLLDLLLARQELKPAMDSESARAVLGMLRQR
ncbi:MAG: succinate dehydrogenase assembly factor 2 [Polynucleobacter sp.]|jgi:antitoxin CptB|uniref:succinate dehydrogenase assembly factor 2 n=1 Tax=unclassified Polynucleobacter TaxID=2640945 RepID=UPI001BFE4E60|nr:MULTISPECIES: succinate dehydrogenase assembly factor 2 [unclassified Polynucleobacter]MBU3725933.1 succinate dehydrogenase assembly factor 2 [Polynucleobacter sp.]MBU6322218.1 succinate dehydrogenase assembly factor 2 [Burkholderiales bacterium]NBO85460.1 succinate dehydrogenase assembly factor 2 [Burkholderiaceae bacterium]NBP19506.1 succinate dehydrogenase assembly factor 2 [Burkholderiaceae bacterium]NBP96824.1 succinate dehydrogenase assembly factor 2 [Burkholderiaceae bacterium]